MNHRHVLSGLAALTAALTFACGNSTSTSSGPTTLSSFADAYCAKVAACCQAANLPTDQTACQALLTSSNEAQQFDPTAGGACQAGFEAESQADFCNDSGSSIAACKSAFSKSGSVAPGGACTDDSDCAAATGGTVSCTPTQNDAGVEATTCVVALKGSLGSKPCFETTSSSNGDESAFFTGTPAAGTQLYSCDLADGLYCDGASGACTNLQVTGGPCTDDVDCVAADACDTTSGTCVARAAEGATCSATSDVDGSPCVSGTYCNGSTCVALLAAGAACNAGDNSCASGFCNDGTCATSASSALSYCKATTDAGQ